jgi:hypothetical protein
LFSQVEGVFGGEKIARRYLTVIPDEPLNNSVEVDRRGRQVAWIAGPKGLGRKWSGLSREGVSS